MELLGIIFQILDDYMNLQSGIYAEKKGSMEDLTEGKFSFPVIHSIRAVPGNTQLINILQQRSEDRAVKVRAVQYMESTGGFQYCRKVLGGLMEQARSYVDEPETVLRPNQGIHHILDLLEIYGPDESESMSPFFFFSIGDGEPRIFFIYWLNYISPSCRARSPFRRTNPSAACIHAIS